MSTIKVGDGEIDTEDVLRHVISGLAVMFRRDRRIDGGFLWCLVSEITTYGSTYSVALCRWAGYDPFTGEALEVHREP